MAGPIAHIFCALAILHSGALKVEDERAFIVGTTYPDIRSLGVISREKTHTKNVQWEDVINASTSFQKGVLLHCLVDDVRIAQLEKPNEQRIPHLPIARSQIVKFFEDSLIYHRIVDWQKILSYFDLVLPEEKMQHNIPEKAIATWHRFIKAYCLQQPGVFSLNTILMQFPELQAHIPIGIPSLASKAYLAISFRSLKKAKLTQSIEDFYNNCVSLITSNAHLSTSGQLIHT